MSVLVAQCGFELIGRQRVEDTTGDHKVRVKNARESEWNGSGFAHHPDGQNLIGQAGSGRGVAAGSRKLDRTGDGSSASCERYEPDREAQTSGEQTGDSYTFRGGSGFKQDEAWDAQRRYHKT